MKIVAIFAENLYAFQYEGEASNEYYRLLDLWSDIVYLRQFAKENNITDFREFIRDIREDALYIDSLLTSIAKGGNLVRLEDFFVPLNDLETGLKTLSLRKGKRYKLRLYAVRIDENLFLITGGVIKIVHKMKDHPDTQKEKQKLQTAKMYLQRNYVFDSDSFYELINEDYED
jgi:hypothetical protein